MENNITKEEVKHIAKLAHLKLNEEQLDKFTQQFGTVLELVSRLNSLDTTGVEPTSQVTGSKNVFREDMVDESRYLTQEEALKNSKRTYRGYFVVEAVFKD